MAAQIEPGMPLSAALRHAILHELSGACQSAAPRGDVSDEDLHETRKHIKRARALLRLAPHSKLVRTSEREIRAAAHALGPAREEVAELECIRKLAQSGIAADLSRALHELVERLAATRVLVRGKPELGEAVSSALDGLERVQERLHGWTPSEQDFSFVADGLSAGFAGGRRALAHALSEPSAENVHAIRRFVKRQYYQLHFLEPIWAAELDAWRDELDELGTLLGEHHDISLLAPSVGQRLCLATVSDDRLLAQRLNERLAEILDAALPIARRIYAERPRAFVARMAEYYALWAAESAAQVTSVRWRH